MSIADSNSAADMDELMRVGFFRKECIKSMLEEMDLEANSSVFFQYVSKIPDISPKDRVTLAEHFLKCLREKSVPITECHYLGLLECYLKSRCLDSAESVVNEMRADGVEISTRIQFLILKCLIETGKLDTAKTMLREISINRNEKNEEMYNMLLYGHAVLGDISNALHQLDEMEQNEIVPGSEVFSSLLKGAVLQGNENYLEKFCREVKNRKINLSNDDIGSVIETMTLAKHLDLLSAVTDVTDSSTLSVIIPYTLTRFIHSGEINFAFQLTKESIGLYKSDKLFQNKMYKSFIEELINAGCAFDSVLKMCQELRQMPECSFAIESALHQYLLNEDIRSSLKILTFMCDNDIGIEPHYFWPLFVAVNRQFGEDGVYAVIGKMTELNVTVDEETMRSFVFPKISLKNMSNCLKRMSLNGVPVAFVEEVFVLYALDNGFFEECALLLKTCNVLKRMIDRGCLDRLEKSSLRALTEFPPTSTSVSLVGDIGVVSPEAVLLHLLKTGNHIQLKKVVKVYLEENVTVDVSALSGRIEFLSPDLQQDIESLWCVEKSVSPKKKSVDLQGAMLNYYKMVEEHEVNRAELEAKNMPSVANGFRLLKLYVKAQMFRKAIKLRNDLVLELGEKLHLTPQYLLLFSVLACHEDNVEEAEHYLRAFINAGFTIDFPKGMELALFFLRHNRLQEVLLTLSALSPLFGDVRIMEHKIILFLKELASLGNIDLVKDIIERLCKRGMMEINGNTAQVFTTTYLARDDIHGAVKEYERVASTYKILSSTYRVLSATVEAGDMELFDKVVSIEKQYRPDIFRWYMPIECIALKEDIPLLLQYLKVYNASITNPKFKKYLTERILKVDIRSLKTLIKAAERLNAPCEEFIRIAVTCLVFSQDWGMAQEFLHFLKDIKDSSKEKELPRLVNFLELAEAMDMKRNLT